MKKNFWTNFCSWFQLKKITEFGAHLWLLLKNWVWIEVVKPNLHTMEKYSFKWIPYYGLSFIISKGKPVCPLILQIFSNLKIMEIRIIVLSTTNLLKISKQYTSQLQSIFACFIKVHCKNTLLLIHILCFPYLFQCFMFFLPALREKKAMTVIESTYLSLGQVAQYYNHSLQMF